MKKHLSQIKHFVAWSTRRIGAPLAFFIAAATVLSHMGAWISHHLHQSSTTSGQKILSKAPYQTPDFHMFAGIFPGDALAASPPSEGGDGDGGDGGDAEPDK